jgi:radical SAM protein with 4Fe4S-binding SPASM domain
LKCPACPSGNGELSRERGFMDFSLFKKIIDDQKDTLINIIFHFQGEPLLHKELGRMINYAKENNIYTMFSTNAQLLAEKTDMIKESGPDKIIISLDGITQESYNKYRINGDINKIYSALKNLSGLKDGKRPFIELQFLVFSHNINEIPEVKKLKKKYKIDRITFKSVQIYDNSQINMLPADEKYLRYEVSDGNFRLRSDLRNKCHRIIFGSVITWNGNVVPCCFDKDAEYITGNAGNEKLNDIRNDNKYKTFINSVFSHRDKIEICKNCTEF